MVVNYTQVVMSRCPAEFIFVYRELGGNLWIRDGRGQTASDLADNSGAPALPHLKLFQGEAPDLLLLLLPGITNPCPFSFQNFDC